MAQYVECTILDNQDNTGLIDLFDHFSKSQLEKMALCGVVTPASFEPTSLTIEHAVSDPTALADFVDDALAAIPIATAAGKSIRLKVADFATVPRYWKLTANAAVTADTTFHLVFREV